ncbi:MAG: hypothetical protein IT303_16530 [Dehalococcoidia bacterium]|nr:hypothetical protein [Dehalococcoidia bacterium]
MRIRTKATAVVAATVTTAALMGGTLGMAFAAPRSQPLYEGMNLVGHVSASSIPPEEFTACLPANSWTGVYLWDNRPQADGGQKWLHFFSGVPDYVNDTDSNGISSIPAFAGVVVLADENVPNAVFKTRTSDTCP